MKMQPRFTGLTDKLGDKICKGVTGMKGRKKWNEGRRYEINESAVKCSRFSAGIERFLITKGVVLLDLTSYFF
jgi:hypothetical protein